MPRDAMEGVIAGAIGYSSPMKIYNYFRSGTSHRLRIVLNLKGLDPDYVVVDLRAEAHLDGTFKTLNPQGLVPMLVDDDLVLTRAIELACAALPAFIKAAPSQQPDVV